MRAPDSGAPLCRTAKPATPPQHLVAYFADVDGESKWFEFSEAPLDRSDPHLERFIRKLCSNESSERMREDTVPSSCDGLRAAQVRASVRPT